MYVPDNSVKIHESKLTEVQLEKGKYTITGKDLDNQYQLDTYWGENTDTLELNSIPTLDLTDIDGTFHPTADYILLEHICSTD